MVDVRPIAHTVGPQRILVIDSDPEEVSSVQGTLRAISNCPVDVAIDDGNAVRMLARFDYDIVVIHTPASKAVLNSLNEHRDSRLVFFTSKPARLRNTNGSDLTERFFRFRAAGAQRPQKTITTY